MLAVVILEPGLPNDVSRLSDASGSVSAEVQINAIALEYRCRRGLAVLSVLERALLQTKDFDVLLNRSGVAVYADGAK